MWTKKEIRKQFDSSMGTFGGTEVGLCILTATNRNTNFQSIGLYNDDRFSVLKSVSGSESKSFIMQGV